MLKKLELEHKKIGQIQLQMGEFKEVEVMYKEKQSQLEEDLKILDINNLTPIEAMNLLMEMKKKLGK